MYAYQYGQSTAFEHALLLACASNERYGRHQQLTV
jgi:hypothetical protein